ncbi:uncharacterized protein I206_103673 [Kwoniella pini CBS 10737]|uniref:Uncharacterized protein n=1 Tax=Kwoniella pini CBS 10737 TaxID=1296096 RepID=A0A1B9I8W8_9TREE|nr:uncharacterized protein I206_01326 [Kwoniella pini CBS 10737]OCF52042.1 hypothetical protein I206_01326 [Kwoniella pini CBS 10737]
MNIDTEKSAWSDPRSFENSKYVTKISKEESFQENGKQDTIDGIHSLIYDENDPHLDINEIKRFKKLENYFKNQPQDELSMGGGTIIDDYVKWKKHHSTTQSEQDNWLIKEITDNHSLHETGKEFLSDKDKKRAEELQQDLYKCIESEIKDKFDSQRYEGEINIIDNDRNDSNNRQNFKISNLSDEKWMRSRGFRIQGLTVPLNSIDQYSEDTKYFQHYLISRYENDFKNDTNEIEEKYTLDIFGSKRKHSHMCRVKSCKGYPINENREIIYENTKYNRDTMNNPTNFYRCSKNGFNYLLKGNQFICNSNIETRKEDFLSFEEITDLFNYEDYSRKEQFKSDTDIEEFKNAKFPLKREMINLIDGTALLRSYFIYRPRLYNDSSLYQCEHKLNYPLPEPTVEQNQEYTGENEDDIYPFFESEDPCEPPELTSRRKGYSVLDWTN